MKNVTDFGAFIDLAGVDGLLHISEMSWGTCRKPEKSIPGWRHSESSCERHQRYKGCTEPEVPGDKSVGKCSGRFCGRFCDHRKSCSYDWISVLLLNLHRE